MRRNFTNITDEMIQWKPNLPETFGD